MMVLDAQYCASAQPSLSCRTAADAVVLRSPLQMPFFQQFTGINAIIFYSPVFFSSLGSGDKTALESSCIVGAVNVLSTLVAVFGVDRVGRRALLLEAGVQMFVAEILVAILLGESASSVSTHEPHASYLLLRLSACSFCCYWKELCQCVCMLLSRSANVDNDS